MNLVDSAVQFWNHNKTEILLGLGVGGVIAGVGLACYETTKIDPIIEDHKEKMTQIHMAADTGIKIDPQTKESIIYTEKDARMDTTKTYAKTGWELTKLYLPSGVVISCSLACILGSHKILSKRNFGLTAAYTGLSQSFDEYRKNIIAKYGEEADLEARYSIKTKKKKDKDGNIEVSYSLPDDAKCSHHSRFFESGSNYWSNNKQMNLNTLFSAEQNLNRKLKTRKSHTVALNEIYAALDLEPSEDGWVLGYTYHPGVDPLDENGLPQKIKFVYWEFDDLKNKNVKKSIAGELAGVPSPEPVMLLDFVNLCSIV